MTAPQRNRGSGLRVGFVGLGQMGAPMCACVARAGFAVTEQLAGTRPRFGGTAGDGRCPRPAAY